VAGCGRQALYGGREAETINPRIPASRFRLLAVIAGDDNGPTLSMSAGLRERLNKEGISARPAAGRWETENEATGDICTRMNFNGVVVVMFNRITLRTCPDREIAFEVEGGDEGLRGLGDRLVLYLKSGMRDSTTVGTQTSP
jgi:hypothetical protein